jgi:hypothetical protein
MIESLFLQPSQIPHRPALLAREYTTVLEHEGAHLLSMHAKSLDGCGTAANQIRNVSMTLKHLLS